MPTEAMARPNSAATSVLTGFSAAMPERLRMASAISAKYSAGPKAIAHFASSGENSTMPQVAMKAPMKELQADSDRATPAMPWRASG